MFERWLRSNNYWWVLGAMFGLLLAASYFGQVAYHYPVPPGDDIFNHLRAMDNLQQNPALWQWGGYPIGFRNLVVWLANWFGDGNILATLKVVWPILPLLSSVAIWFVASKLFSRRVGLLALVVYGFVSLQPLQTLYDGGLPNVFAGNTLLPLALLVWASIWQAIKLPSRRLYWLVGGFLALSLIIFYCHHLSAVVLAATVLLSSPFLAVQAFKSSQSPAVRSALYVLIGVCALAVATVILSPIGRSITDLIEVVKSYRQPTPPWEWYRYHTSINGLLFQASIAGTILLGWRSIKNFLTVHPSRIVLLTWFLFYLVGSRLTFVAEPERLARDLAMPGAIIASYFVVEAYRYLANELILRRVFVVVVGLALLLGVGVKMLELASYNPMVRFSQSDQELLSAVRQSASPVGIQVQNGGWHYLAKAEIDSGQVIILRRYATVKKRFSAGQCVYLSYYKDQVWPPESHSRKLLDRVIKNQQKLGVSVNYFNEDPLKVWYQACPSKT